MCATRWSTVLHVIPFYVSTKQNISQNLHVTSIQACFKIIISAGTCYNSLAFELYGLFMSHNFIAKINI